MTTQLRCSDLMPGCTCTFVLEGRDGDELVANAVRHAKNDHGIVAIPPELTAKLRAAIAAK